jgi:proteasome-associated ATPase
LPRLSPTAWRARSRRKCERGESHFLNVKGPELLNKYVGETEQAFATFLPARNQLPIGPRGDIFDEMDSMFRVRLGISSDMESTIGPQFLAELDGLQALQNVVVIGATNREDLIDPAVLRPGRLDRKVRIPRPDKRAAFDIFSKYLTADLPIDACHLETLGGCEKAVQWMIQQAVDELYSETPENELFEITFADGNHKTLYCKDLCSGAIIANIVSRAKFLAVKDLVEKGRKGITDEHITRALRAEFEENEDLPSNSNPAEWYRIIGKSGERVIRMRALRKSVSKSGPPEPEMLGKRARQPEIKETVMSIAKLVGIDRSTQSMCTAAAPFQPSRSPACWSILMRERSA